MPRETARILICCETNAGLEAVIPQLRTRNYVVIQAPSVYRAISIHSADPADIVILDANNFSEKEYEVFDIFREALPGVRMFATISMNRRDKTPALLRCGVDGYFLEPFYVDEILSAMEKAMMPATPEAIAAPADQADKLAALGRFARGVAHEVNNPLATLSGWVQIFLSEREADDPQRATLEVMQQELDRIEKVVQDLLAFSGQPSPKRDEVDVNATLRNLVRSRERTDGGNYTTTFDEKIPKVFANQQQLRDAFSLLLDFCRSKESAKGTIDVSTRADHDGAVIIIRSPAARVEENVINGLFDPFRSSNGDGSEGGLGLSISYGIVKGLGGTISTEREAGRGITFTLTVPAASVQQGAR